jgi:hypothetical protein
MAGLLGLGDTEFTNSCEQSKGRSGQDVWVQFLGLALAANGGGVCSRDKGHLKLVAAG